MVNASFRIYLKPISGWIDWPFLWIIFKLSIWKGNLFLLREVVSLRSVSSNPQRERTWTGRTIWRSSTQGPCLEVQHGLGTRPLASPWSASSCFPEAFALVGRPSSVFCREFTFWFPLELGFLQVSVLKQFRRMSRLTVKHPCISKTLAAHVYERLGKRSGAQPLDTVVSCVKGKFLTRRKRWAWFTQKIYIYGNVTVRCINQHN